MIVIQQKVCSNKKCHKVFPATSEWWHFGSEAHNCGYKTQCKECRKQYTKEWTEQNPDYHKQYYADPNNKDRNKANEEDYRKTNREKINATKRTYRKKRKETDPLYKASENVRTLVRSILKSKKEGNKTEKILGCSFEFFKEYIEARFSKGMDWSNQGGLKKGKWQLHHLMPIHTAEDDEELFLLNHYTNFYPLWTKDHLETHRHLTRCGL